MLVDRSCPWQDCLVFPQKNVSIPLSDKSVYNLTRGLRWLVPWSGMLHFGSLLLGSDFNVTGNVTRRRTVVRV